MSTAPAHWDVVVIGAGAAGMFCAATAGARGRSVLLLDHGDCSGAKVLVSGGGRCNFTNRDVSATHYLSENPHFCKSALARFTPGALVELVEKHGVHYHERENGQLFCDGSAREIVALLQEECAAARVELLLGCRVASVGPGNNGGFRVETSGGTVFAASLVIATGGLSYAKLGASSFGFDVARRFGLGVVPPRPALVPFVFAKPEREIFASLAGVSLEATISNGRQGHAGRILFTHRGLSGPAALQASLRWQPGQALAIDLLPGKDLLGELLARRRAKIEPAAVLGAYLPKSLAKTWCSWRGLTRPLDQTPERALRLIAAGLHDWRLTPGGTEGYATAEVTAGGVDTDGLSSTTMEAKRVPGLYFVGEVVDVTGELGGYNLHWAWSSAHAAGMSV